MYPLIASVVHEAVRSPDTFVKNVLATAGGAVVGAAGTAVLCIILFRLLHVKKIPRKPVALLSILGGIAVGWAVWLWVHSSPGYGPGPGGGVFVGTGTDKGTGPSPRDTAPATRKEPADTIRVAIVRSADYKVDSKQYYLVDGKPPARNLAETLQALKDKQQLNPMLKTVEVVIYQDSIAEALGQVTDLQEAARPAGLTVKTYKPGTDAP
jgi:hypothetical protein